jgi:hypothetical protein
MKITTKYILLFQLLIMVACVSPYYPNITKYDNLLVVDGQMTNLTGPYKINLSRTIKYDGALSSKVAGEPVTGSQVKIIDNAGFEIQLKEISSGEYSTVDTTFRGVPGKSYKVQIKVNNEIFESDFETLKPPTPIDKLYWEYKPLDTEGPKRVQLSLDTHDATNNTRYYAWQYNETWKFKVPIDVVGKPEWKICYQYNSSRFINIGTTINRYTDVVSKYPLQTINESTNRLFIRYTLLAKQYSLSEQTYNYFSDLTKLNLNQGSLFDPTPCAIIGNIKCLTNKNVPVLGYFVVAGACYERNIIC